MAGARGVFFDGDDARLAAERLRRDGFEAEVARQPLAGEDDDEDHPWVVVTDAPVVMLELLVEAHDGWLEEAAAPPPPVPLVLPRPPRRLHRDTPEDRRDPRLG